MKTKNSSPFSNGMEYEYFQECWCGTCTHLKLRDDGFPELPENDGCPILDAMELARIDRVYWPEKEVVEEWDDDGNISFWHKCTGYKKKTDRR